MKKGGLHFLSRKNQSLFDTNVQMKDIDNAEFVYDGVAFPDSGTAKVRARPTIKHFNTFGEGAGFAVPTPTVPVLSSFTAPQISHTGKSESLSNGSAISMVGPEEVQIPIPPPPSTAPPPPPPQFIPPPPGHAPPPSPFSGETYSPVVLSSLEPPSMPPPKPPSVGTPDDLSVLRPPPMAPPKPPSYQISTSSPEDIPECPKFTPPLPPTEKPQSPITKVQKMPPPKPIRYSSMSNLLLSGQSDTQDGTPLENSSKNLTSVKEMSTSQILVPPVKPMRRNSSGNKLEEDIQDFKNNVHVALPKQSVSNSMAATVQTPSTAPDEISTLMRGSPTAERSSAMLSAQDVLHATPVNPMTKYSPLLNSKLQSLKTSEPPSGKEVAASPFALLMAAKERDKQRAAISRQNSTSSTDSTSGSIHLSDTRTNSFTVTPRTPLSSGSASPSMDSKHNTENPKVTYARLAEPSSSILNKNATSIASPTSPSGHHNGFDTTSFIPPPPEFANSDAEDEGPPSMLPPDPPTKRTDAASSLNSIRITNGSTNSTSITSSSTTPPITATPIRQSKPKPQDSPTSKTKIQPQVPPQTPPKVQIQPPPQTQSKIQPQAPPPSLLKTQTQIPPPTQPNFQPQAPPPPKIQPQAPPPTQPKIQYQPPPTTQPKFQPHAPPLPQLKTQAQAPPPTLPKAQPQAPPSVAASQATLLSILQKKMLEMDPKFAQSREVDIGSDEWSSAPFDDAVGGPSLNSTPKSSAGLNMKELENKMTNKVKAKAPASTGASKQQFGMTFLVRPGTKQPITPVPKTE